MSARPNDRDEVLRTHGLQIAMRLFATLRTGRSYSIGNQAFTRQLQQLLESLLPVLAEHGEALVVSHDGDLHLNGVRLPHRSSSQKFIEQLAQEIQLREIAGVEFRAGLKLAELESFMRYFMPSELYKGAELIHACAIQDFRHVRPLEAVSEEEHAGAHDEAGPARMTDAYARALRNARLLLADPEWQHGLELRHLKRVAQPLVDDALEGGPGAAALAGVPPSGTAWEHAVHVCAVAVAVGRRLGLDRAALSELGVAALLHDAGEGTGAGRESSGPAGQGHTIDGVRRIALMTTLNATSFAAMRAALEHHATGTGGYPALPNGWRAAPVSQVVAIADAYVGMLEHRESGHLSLTPCDALARVLGPLAQRFHPGLRAALVRALGVYPPGQLVELDDGSVVRSLGGTSENPARPVVEQRAGEGAQWSAGPLPVERTVRRALPLSEWPGRSQAA